MDVVGATKDLIGRIEDYRFDIRCELLSHNVVAVNTGHVECRCDHCELLRPLPALLLEAADGIRCRTILGAVTA